MKSVKLLGIVRVSGNTLVGGFYETLLVDQSESHHLTMTNITKKTIISVSYNSSSRKLVKVQIKPGASVGIELGFIDQDGLVVQINNDCVGVFSDQPKLSSSCNCNYCGSLLNIDGCPVCDE